MQELTKVAHYQAQHLYRERYIITQSQQNKIVIAGNALINFAGNDYLGLSQHPLVKAAAIEAIQEYGLGSGASPMIAGFYQPQQDLEEQFAKFMQYEAALLFNSGYHANTGIFAAIADRHSVVISDKYCHASILAGIQLSRARHLRFPHQDLQQLEYLLQTYAHQGPTVIVSEGIFSMEGDLAHLDSLAALAKQYQTQLIIDDAHGMGVLGREGRGVLEHYQLSTDALTYLVMPLGKALGSQGAMVLGSRKTIDALTQFAKSYVYSTALPPAIAKASSVALRVLQEDAWRRKRLQQLIQYFNQGASARGLKLLNELATPIRIFIVGDNQKVLQVQNHCIQQGFYVSCIRAPTVPLNTARLRISLNCHHEESDIDGLLDQLQSLLVE